MRPATLLFITALIVCQPLMRAQLFTNALPGVAGAANAGGTAEGQEPLPNDPGAELMPRAVTEPSAEGEPVRWEADEQSWTKNTVTLTGRVAVFYRDMTLRADHVVYETDTTEAKADGHLTLDRPAMNLHLEADHGELRVNARTGRFYQVTGSVGLRTSHRNDVYSTANPFLFSGRVLIEAGDGRYQLVDGEFTNCALPHPDWRVLAKYINVEGSEASTRGAVFELLNAPLFYFPYLSHSVDEAGRESGVLVPAFSNSSIKGLVVGEQYYWVINRSMDMVVGLEYYSKRGWAPNGDFRWKGAGQNYFNMRWNALVDRGVEEAATTGSTTTTELVNQGGADILALGRRDFNEETHAAIKAEYLSSYVYRLVFNDNYELAANSEILSVASLTRNIRGSGYVSSLSIERAQAFASSDNGNQVRILHLPNLRFDVLDRTIGSSAAMWSFGSSLDYLSRSEPSTIAGAAGFHARNVGRFDFEPYGRIPIAVGGWSFEAGGGFRDTLYTGSQYPDVRGVRQGLPAISHNSLNRLVGEAEFQIRPPELERDFALRGGTLRHVIEPELDYRFVGGIGRTARRVLLVDSTDIVTDTNELTGSLTQRIYWKPKQAAKCEAGGDCEGTREPFASWTVAGRYYFNPTFGGAIVNNRRNVFDATLDYTSAAFLTGERTFAPLTSRMRVEPTKDLRVEWDLDYDTQKHQLAADNIFAGYTRGDATFGLGYSMLAAVDQSGAQATTIHARQIQPYFTLGRQTGRGFNMAANMGYDLVQDAAQYYGAQVVYNFNCCGLTVGYRRFNLGQPRDEGEWLYSFTIANFGSVGDVRRTNSVFRDPTLPPAF